MHAMSAAPGISKCLHHGDKMLCPRLLRVLDTRMRGRQPLAVVGMLCRVVCFGLHVMSIEPVQHTMFLLRGALCLRVSYVRKHGRWGEAAWRCHCLRKQRHCW